MKLVFYAIALGLATAATAASAEDIYRSLMPDGRVLYGESPAPGAKSYKKVPPPQASGVITVTPAEQKRHFDGGPARPAVSVVPPPQRPSPQPHAQGLLQGGTGLPQRGY